MQKKSSKWKNTIHCLTISFVQWSLLNIWLMCLLFTHSSTHDPSCTHQCCKDLLESVYNSKGKMGNTDLQSPTAHTPFTLPITPKANIVCLTDKNMFLERGERPGYLRKNPRRTWSLHTERPSAQTVFELRMRFTKLLCCACCAFSLDAPWCTLNELPPGLKTARRKKFLFFCLSSLLYSVTNSLAAMEHYDGTWDFIMTLRCGSKVS